MKRVDFFSFSLSVLLNLLLLLIFSNFSNQKVIGKIKVGLVTMDNNKNSYSEKKKSAEITTEKKQTIEVVKEVPQKKVFDIDTIEISAPKINILNKKNIQVPKKNIVNSNKIEKTLTFNGDGAPSGYKLGSTDGDIIATWDPNNQEPVYPESAQLKGLNGTVKLKLNIDEYGNIKNINFQKGSGVPEINLSIEKVARTWKIYLKKNSVVVKGEVILEYSFKLTGNN